MDRIVEIKHLRNAITMTIGGRRKDSLLVKFWLLFKSHEYNDRREKVFDRQAYVRARIRIRQDMQRTDYLLKRLAEEGNKKNAF